MFSLQHISKSYNEWLVLDDASLSIGPNEVAVLIGENGAGKTTLLDILTGRLRPDTGQVNLSGVIGYVPQEADQRLLVTNSFEHDQEDWQKIVALEKVGLGGKPLDLSVSKLSGGQRTRLALAATLAHDPEPNILLLDEPTNNLDSEGLHWLSQFVKGFNGAVLIVSHDRAFINSVATKIVELDRGKIKEYGGDYDFYKHQKEVERMTEVQEYEKRLAEKQHLEEYFKRTQYRAKYGSRNAIKDNDKAQFNWKLQNAQNSFSRQAQALKTKLARYDDIQKPTQIKSYKVALSGGSSDSKLIMKFDNVSFGYGGKPIIRCLNLEIRGSDRVRVVGKNGAGKSTLLKLAMGQLVPGSGSIVTGSGVKIGYFSQDVDGLDQAKTLIENLPGSDLTLVHGLAHILGVTDPELRKPVGQLSRGQQAKIGIAKLLMGDNHLLILDEPTNHLDIKTREYIEDALKSYKGSVLFASHDEYFANAIGLSSEQHILGVGRGQMVGDG